MDRLQHALAYIQLVERHWHQLLIRVANLLPLALIFKEINQQVVSFAVLQ